MSDRADWVIDFLKSRGVDPCDVGEAMSAVLDQLVNCEHEDTEGSYCLDCGAKYHGKDDWVLPRRLETLPETLGAVMAAALKASGQA
jgi:hypothetical protein